ncbi:hypothetical protein Bhyg_15274 [Pseudolycoriella hygida]|uniref:Uncharacterized protein n=1 Tax=Pseudolycoriella hygida TaxID=35572 RepID=A0A9Q0MRK1_9DIPT|nr:hypothetical protein Bhyg_15274 [Pseudolycoriella hygida]
MVHVDNFLGCTKLETGGIILAWFHIVFYALSVVSIFILIGVIFLTDIFDGNANQVVLRDDQISPIKEKEIPVVSLAILVVLLIIFSIAVVVVAYRSISAIKTNLSKGIRTENDRNTKSCNGLKGCKVIGIVK